MFQRNFVLDVTKVFENDVFIVLRAIGCGLQMIHLVMDLSVSTNDWINIYEPLLSLYQCWNGNTITIENKYIFNQIGFGTINFLMNL